VLVTRPADDAAPLADRLRGLGFEPVVEPMLAIMASGASLDLDGVQAVLLTSANGARALARATARRDLLVLAVGDATARAARAAGFLSIESAGGDVVDLAGLAKARCTPAAGPLLHVSGRETAGDLAGHLAMAGFALRRAVLYRAEPAAALSPALRERLAAGGLDAALFLSPRTARSFVTLVEAANLAACCRRMAALCLSPAVADALPAASWKAVRIAAAPTQAALLDALQRWADESGQDRGTA
jgi:uroporphyrinogen-III synthase